jgi:hypothetical protein
MPELIHNKEIEELKKYKENLEWFQSNYPQLKEQYKGEYVAIKDRNVIAHNSDLQQLLNNIDKDNTSMVIEHINEQRYLYIL